MNIGSVFPIVALVLSCSTQFAFAQDAEPRIDTSEAEEETSLLRLEELIADEGQLELDLSFALSSRSNNGVSSAFGTVDLGGGQILSFPTSIDERQVETDTLLINGGLRYGLSENLELSARASFAGSDTRIVDAGSLIGSDGSLALNDVFAGLSYQFSEDDGTPALIGFADLALAEALDPEGDGYAHGKTLNAGFRTYRVIDPIVFALTAGYRHAAERSVDGVKIDPGDVLYVSPGVAFAVNDTTTLTGGVNISRIFSGKIAGADVGTDRTRAELEFGAGYGISRDLTLRAAARADVAGDSGFTGLLALQYKFGNGR